MSKPLLSALVGVALACGTNVALGQDKADGKAAEELKKQNPVPPATGRNMPDQNATQEPSSKVQLSKADPNVFARGVLTVPGALLDVDTAPAKFSARTDADDQIPIAGYRLRQLTQQQRREIVQQLTDNKGSTGTNSAYAIVGAAMPAAALQDLAPMPEKLTARFPELRGTAFMRAGNKFVVVDLNDSLVVGVLETG